LADVISEVGGVEGGVPPPPVGQEINERIKKIIVKAASKKRGLFSGIDWGGTMFCCRCRFDVPLF
jgi:hypothetical protein